MKTQICVPTSQRQRLMTLAHDKFGHLSRNKVVQHITKSFYWPTLWRDVRVHVQGCDVCQRVTKKSPKKAPMVKRELVTVPFERVLVDLVGPLPKSKGGFQYLFTYIDNTCRWPEAEPLRNITAKTVVRAFQNMFKKWVPESGRFGQWDAVLQQRIQKLLQTIRHKVHDNFTIQASVKRGSGTHACYIDGHD